LLATKFVTTSLDASLSVPPTICFTTPSCRSIHGRKRMMARTRRAVNHSQKSARRPTGLHYFNRSAPRADILRQRTCTFHHERSETSGSFVGKCLSVDALRHIATRVLSPDFAEFAQESVENVALLWPRRSASMLMAWNSQILTALQLHAKAYSQEGPAVLDPV
jgi:hypothetical protein